MSVLLLDFDGVLIDSVEETVLTAFNAVTDQTVTSHSELPTGFRDRILASRSLIHPAGDFLTVATLILEKGEPGADEIRTALKNDPLPQKARAERFFRARKRFQAADLAAWLALHRAFQPFFGFCASLPRETRVILTNKNREATAQLCAHFGWALAPEDIYSGDGGVTKSENLLSIRSRLGDSDYHFIDDQLSNLLGLNGVSRILATWGYGAKGEQAAAAQHGVEVVGQEQAIELFTRRGLRS